MLSRCTAKLSFYLKSAGLSLLCMGLSTVAVSAQNPVTVTNVLQNHYHYGYALGSQDCPAGYNIPSGQYPTTYHLERGHAIHHLDPVTSANDYWVYWAHFDNSSYGVAEVAVFKSTTECGPYILQTGLSSSTNTDGSGYGFQPGGWQSRDEIIFDDAATQTYNPDGTVAAYAGSYLISASDSLNTVKSSSNSTCGYANDSIAIFKMTPDYMGIDTTTSPSTNGANWTFICDQREAPVMFRQGNKYFLITSQAAGWYPSQGGYGVSNGPLTGWTPDPLALGNASTFGGQTSGGFTIAGTQANTYILTFDHLGGLDSKNPAYSQESTDTGGTTLPVILDGTAGTATLNWEPSFTVDNTSGVLTLPTLTNLASARTAGSTVLTYPVSGTTTYVPGNAVDGNFATRWAGSLSGASSFTTLAAPVKDTNNGSTTTLCPITGATVTTKCNPSLIVDLGSVQPVQEIDLSFYMVKGSEPYYTYKIAYSSDDANWSTLDFTSFAQGSNSSAMNESAIPFNVNVTYGFNPLLVNFSARYVALIETSVVQQNSPSPFYGPGVYEMSVIQSTAPTTPQAATVSVVPSTTRVSASTSFTVQVNVAGPNGSAMPSGYIQLSVPGYTSETYGLVSGANNYTVPAGVVTGGTQTITVSYRPDATSEPIYGLATVTGTAAIYIDVPAAPTNLALAQSSPAALTLTYTAAPGATSYIVYRSLDNGSTYAQLSTTSGVSYGDTGLTNGNTYCYEVASVNAAGTGSPSAGVCAAATANFPVTNIAVTPTAYDVLTLSYTAVANATSYIIKRSVAGGAYAQLANQAATTYTDSNLTAGTNYCYTVAAIFSTGNGADSSPICAVGPTNFPVTNITVTPSTSTSLVIAYSAVANATSYVIKRSIGGAAYTKLATPTTLSYTDPGLTNGVNYCYTVAAVFAGGTAQDSSPVCTTATNTIIAVTVNDFSFESPSTTTYIYLPAINGTTQPWTFTASASTTGSGVTTNASGFTASNSTAPAGTQVAFLQGVGVAYQTMSGLTPGQTYKITVAASQRANKTGGQLGNPFEIRVDGSAIATIMATQGVTTYTDFSATFTATATSHVIGFYGTNALANGTYPDNTVFIDNVRLVVYPPAAGTSSTPNNLWVVNGNGTLTRTDEQGNVQTSAVGSTGNASPYGGVAIDSNGGVWSVSSANNFINFVSKTGTTPSTVTDPSLNFPTAIAIDGAGTVWVANSGGNALSAFTPAGTLRGTVTDSSISGSSGVAIDGSGNVWISNANNNTVDEVIGSAAPSTPLAAAATSNTPGARP